MCATKSFLRYWMEPPVLAVAMKRTEETSEENLHVQINGIIDAGDADPPETMEQLVMSFHISITSRRPQLDCT